MLGMKNTILLVILIVSVSSCKKNNVSPNSVNNYECVATITTKIKYINWSVTDTSITDKPPYSDTQKVFTPLYNYYNGVTKQFIDSLERTGENSSTGEVKTDSKGDTYYEGVDKTFGCSII